MDLYYDIEIPILQHGMLDSRFASPYPTKLSKNVKEFLLTL